VSEAVHAPIYAALAPLEGGAADLEVTPGSREDPQGGNIRVDGSAATGHQTQGAGCTQAAAV